MENKNVNNTTQKQPGGITGKGFKPGQSGNPAGRPPGSVSITTEIKKKLDEVPEGQKKTYLELLINRILKQAVVDGDVQMAKTIWSYVDGMPKQSTDITSGGEKIDFGADDLKKAKAFDEWSKQQTKQPEK